MAKYKLVFNVYDVEKGVNIVPKSQNIFEIDETKQKPDIRIEEEIKTCFLTAANFSVPLLLEDVRYKEAYNAG